MENSLACSFFGHRDIKITDELYSSVLEQIEKAINFGCRIFYFGGFGAFDSLCYDIVTAKKAELPSLGISRVFCVPDERGLRKTAYYSKNKEYEDFIYLPLQFDYWYKRIYFRNCAIIDKSDFVICYAEERQGSGAFKAYKYAKSKKNKRTVNLY